MKLPRETQEIVEEKGFARDNSLGYVRSVNGVRQQLDIRASSWDDTCYLYAYVDTFPIPHDFTLGGRVSPGGVDYLDYSYPSETFSEKDSIRDILDYVVVPWFSVFDCSEQFTSVVDNIDRGWDRHASLGDSLPETYQMLSNLGFSAKVEENAVVFFKKTLNIWHIVQIEIISHGVFLAVRVASWIPELQVAETWQTDSSPEQFDSLMIINGGFINGSAVENTLTKALNISSDSEKASSDRKLCELLDTCVAEYFSFQKTRSDLIASVHEQYRRSSYFADVLGT